MDTKKVLQQLIKIADNQQKIINKLAQQQGLSAMPERLEPNPTQKTPARALLEALHPAVRQAIVTIEPHGNDMMVQFQPGKATQPNYDAVLKTLQDLTDRNIIQQAYTLKVA